MGLGHGGRGGGGGGEEVPGGLPKRDRSPSAVALGGGRMSKVPSRVSLAVGAAGDANTLVVTNPRDPRVGIWMGEACRHGRS